MLCVYVVISYVVTDVGVVVNVYACVINVHVVIAVGIITVAMYVVGWCCCWLC